jgi:hypothetical protein
MERACFQEVREVTVEVPVPTQVSYILDIFYVRIFFIFNVYGVSEAVYLLVDYRRSNKCDTLFEQNFFISKIQFCADSLHTQHIWHNRHILSGNLRRLGPEAEFRVLVKISCRLRTSSGGPCMGFKVLF